MDEIKYSISNFEAQEDGSISITALIINDPKVVMYRFGYNSLKFVLGEENSVTVTYDAFIDYAGEETVIEPEKLKELEATSKVLIEKIIMDFIADFNKQLDESAIKMDAEIVRIT